MLVPSPAFRSMAGGIMLAVVFVLAATLTLLPAVLGKLGHRIDALALPWVHIPASTARPRFAAWGERLWQPPGPLRRSARWSSLLALAAPVIGLRTAMPSINVLPEDASRTRRLRPRPGRLRPRRSRHPADRHARRSGRRGRHRGLAGNAGIAAVMPAQQAADGSDWSLIQAVPTVDPSDPELAATVDRLRADLPDVGAGRRRRGGEPRPQHPLNDSTPLVIGVILALGFLLLLVALQAPLIAAARHAGQPAVHRRPPSAWPG